MQDQHQGIYLGSLILKNGQDFSLTYAFFSFTTGVNVCVLQKPAELRECEAGVCVSLSKTGDGEKKSVEPMMCVSACELESDQHALNSCVLLESKNFWNVKCIFVIVNVYIIQTRRLQIKNTNLTIT